jgi:hypothetical protein
VKGEAAALSVRAQRCQSHYFSITPCIFYFCFLSWVYESKYRNYCYYSQHAGHGLQTPGVEVNAHKTKYAQPSIYVLIAFLKKKGSVNQNVILIIQNTEM